jgi:glycyl-tRNA synthetase alpha subunit
MNKKTLELLEIIVEVQKGCSKIRFEVDDKDSSLKIYDASHTSIKRLIEKDCIVSMSDGVLNVIKL